MKRGPIPFPSAVLNLAVARHEDARRTRRAMTASVVFHVLLFAWIVTIRPEAVASPEPIEIEMIEPGDAEAAAAGPLAAAAPEPAGTPAAGAPRPGPEQRFRREDARGDVEPVPVSETATADQLAARLASLRRTSPMPGRVTDASPAAAWGASSSVPAGLGGGGTAQSMSRGGALGGAPALTLTRGGGGGPAGGGGIAPSRIAAKSTASEPAAPGRDDASRSLAGARLLGPVADRPIVHVVTPAYPEWAKRDGVEGAVTLHFIVRADGSVKENVLVERTAGFEDFDENARVALRAWRFEPLRAGRTGEQWGTITFHYRLRDAG